MKNIVSVIADEKYEKYKFIQKRQNLVPHCFLPSPFK